MNKYEKQMIGVLAEDNYSGLNGKDSAFVNSTSSIQYAVRSMTLPDQGTDLYTGYMNSFEEEEFDDDEYDDYRERIDHFKDHVSGSLFIFTPKSVDYVGDFPKLTHAYLTEKPSGFDKNSEFYPIPVFGAADDDTFTNWESDKRWSLYRGYKTLEEFKEYVIHGKPVGSLYGNPIGSFTPSFFIWKDIDGRLYAIGTLINARNDTLGNIILEMKNFYKIDISAYNKYVVYDIGVNPTILFIPENIYKTIEDELIKISIKEERTNGSEALIKTNDNANETTTSDVLSVAKNDLPEDSKSKSDVITESPSEGSGRGEVNNNQPEVISQIDAPVDEELIEIDTSKKDDLLIINSMDYHSKRSQMYYSRKDFINVHTAIKSDSLVILSGLSGTGKSAIVDIYAKALNAANTERLLFIPVRPSWNDDSDLLGYVDLVHMVYRPSDTGFVDLLVKAEQNTNQLYIVCFDEMNLARVEHYFSQFLSVLERPEQQREIRLYDEQYRGRLYNSSTYPSKIKIGNNIRFIGTVNIDESTYHFSDKVLDRANVIELDVLNYSTEWNNSQYASLRPISWTVDDYVKLIKNSDTEGNHMLREFLWEVHQLLQTAGSKFGVGPRVVKSIERYLANLPNLDGEDFSVKTALDYQIAQRVLTKIRGSESQLGSILDADNDQNLLTVFDKFKELSDFSKCRKIILQKQKELSVYGYCV